jgi:hypothetical protein
LPSETPSAAVPDESRQQLFDEWFAGTYEEQPAVGSPTMRG